MGRPVLFVSFEQILPIVFFKKHGIRQGKRKEIIFGFTERNSAYGITGKQCWFTF